MHNRRWAAWVVLAVTVLHGQPWTDGMVRGDSRDGSRYVLADTYPHFTFSAGAVAVDSADRVYVADTEQGRILKFDDEGHLLAAWGRRGDGPGEYKWPGGVAVDARGHIFVADTGNHRIQKLSRDGRFLAQWGLESGVDCPQGVAVDRQGNVYDVETWVDRVLKFSNDGRPMRAWELTDQDEVVRTLPESLRHDRWERRSAAQDLRGIAVDRLGQIHVVACYSGELIKLDAAGVVRRLVRHEDLTEKYIEFYRPRACAVDLAGNIYVVDRGSGRVFKLDSHYNLMAILVGAAKTDGYGSYEPFVQYDTWWHSRGASADGELCTPCGIAVDSHGYIYVADRGNSRIQKFAPDGKFVSKWGGPGTEPGQFWHPYGLAIGARDELYVADGCNNRVQKLAADGRVLTTWGTAGNGPGQFDYAARVAVGPTGTVYVVDYNNHRVQWFDGGGGYLGQVSEGLKEPWGVATDAAGNFLVTDKAREAESVSRYTPNGKLIGWPVPEGIATGIVVGEDNTVYTSLFDDGVYAKGTLFAPIRAPLSLARDRHGNTYVADRGRDMITKLDPKGTRLASWGVCRWGEDPYGGDSFGGEAWWRFAIIGGIAVDSADNVFVADVWRHRILKFRPVASGEATTR